MKRRGRLAALRRTLPRQPHTPLCPTGRDFAAPRKLDCVSHLVGENPAVHAPLKVVGGHLVVARSSPHSNHPPTPSTNESLMHSGKTARSSCRAEKWRDVGRISRPSNQGRSQSRRATCDHMEGGRFFLCSASERIARPGGCRQSQCEAMRRHWPRCQAPRPWAPIQSGSSFRRASVGASFLSN